MKARNPSTGNLETVYVKALDSLPVGAEIDFDGDSADIPTGWEQVDNVLWENTNPTSNFAGQTINLETNSYTEYNVYYKINNSLDYVRVERVVVGTLGIIVFPTTTGFTSNNSARWLTAISNQSITFGDATTGGTTSNNLLVPIKVVGVN